MIYEPGDKLLPGWQDDTEAGWHAGKGMAAAWRHRKTTQVGDMRFRRISYLEARAIARQTEISPHARALYLAYARYCGRKD